MKAIEFPTKITKDRKIDVPEKFKNELKENQKARVIILLESENEDKEWSELTTEQFLGGYLVNDSSYDKL